MAQKETERFYQRMYDELDELERKDRQRLVELFVELGRRVHIDVVAEILDKGKSTSEVLEAIHKGQGINYRKPEIWSAPLE